MFTTLRTKRKRHPGMGEYQIEMSLKSDDKIIDYLDKLSERNKPIVKELATIRSTANGTGLSTRTVCKRVNELIRGGWLESNYGIRSIHRPVGRQLNVRARFVYFSDSAESEYFKRLRQARDAESSVIQPIT